MASVERNECNVRQGYGGSARRSPDVGAESEKCGEIVATERPRLHLHSENRAEITAESEDIMNVPGKSDDRSFLKATMQAAFSCFSELPIDEAPTTMDVLALKARLEGAYLSLFGKDIQPSLMESEIGALVEPYVSGRRAATMERIGASVADCARAMVKIQRDIELFGSDAERNDEDATQAESAAGAKAANEDRKVEEKEGSEPTPAPKRETGKAPEAKATTPDDEFHGILAEIAKNGSARTILVDARGEFPDESRISSIAAAAEGAIDSTLILLIDDDRMNDAIAAARRIRPSTAGSKGADGRVRTCRYKPITESDFKAMPEHAAKKLREEIAAGLSVFVPGKNGRDPWKKEIRKPIVQGFGPAGAEKIAAALSELSPEVVEIALSSRVSFHPLSDLSGKTPEGCEIAWKQTRTGVEIYLSDDPERGVRRGVAAAAHIMAAPELRSAAFEAVARDGVAFLAAARAEAQNVVRSSGGGVRGKDVFPLLPAISELLQSRNGEADLASLAEQALSMEMDPATAAFAVRFGLVAETDAPEIARRVVAASCAAAVLAGSGFVNDGSKEAFKVATKLVSNAMETDSGLSRLAVIAVSGKQRQETNPKERER